MQQGQGGDSSDVEGQAVYAGGSERRHGAEEVNSDVSPKPEGSKAFKGSGYRLGDGERQETAVQKRKMVKTTPGSNKRRRIVVEEGEGNVENESGDESEEGSDDDDDDASSGVEEAGVSSDDAFEINSQVKDPIEVQLENLNERLKKKFKRLDDNLEKEIEKATKTFFRKIEDRQKAYRQEMEKTLDSFCLAVKGIHE